MTTTYVLVPGFWLGGWAWDGVSAHLLEFGFSVTAVTLPGLESPGADRSSIGLADHIDAVDEVVPHGDGEVILVAHSGAGKVVSGFLDRRPSAVRRMIYVDSGPSSPGAADDVPPDVVELPLPSWEDLASQGNSLEGLSPSDLEQFRAGAVPHPAGPPRDRLELTNDADRRRVPSTIVACSLSSAVVGELAAAGHPMFAEVAQLSDLRYLDLPTGHWPMWSKPRELAAALVQAAS